MTLKSFLHEFLIFGMKEAQACSFAGSFFVVLFLSKHIPLFGLARYDFIFLAAVLLQIILIAIKIETFDELKTIFLFHLIGLCLELFKTSSSIGSWHYPEAAFFKIATVPLYSGFMYAAVASYFSQAWRILKARVEKYPSYWVSIPLCIAIYVNFFTDSFGFDIRWILTALVVIVFWGTTIHFTITEKERKMPLVLAYLLVAFFIWMAENISTLFGAWEYPNQVHAWNLVATQKVHSWFLLVIISFIIIADLKQLKRRRTQLLPDATPQSHLTARCARPSKPPVAVMFQYLKSHPVDAADSQTFC
jgi:uncharacterized membrane protein YoaT (DUF817 family)